MPPDLDTLLIALYVLADDLLPKRSGPGRKPRINDASVIALAVAQVFLDCPAERRFLRFARARLGHLFPYIPKQSGYNKRVRALASQVCLLINLLAREAPSFCDRLRLLDSTPVPCAQSHETVKRSDLAGHAAYGYCASHSRFFWGFRLYLVCSPDGMPHGFCLAPANEPEREVAAALLDRMRRDGSLHGFELIIADKGFAGADFERAIAELGATLLRPSRQDEPNRPTPPIGPIRQRIESIVQTLKDQLRLEHHLARTPAGLLARITARILALNTAIHLNWQLGQPTRHLSTYGH